MTSSRVVSGANAAVALGLVAVLAGVALVVRPPAPPGIAEFAPQASKPITKAPLGQAVAGGRGPGACAAGQPCTADGATPLPTAVASALPGQKPRGVPSALQCYTWSDGSVTQTFDPQSPPCIAGWDETAGNGGATAQGVSATEIRVVLPEWYSPTGQQVARAYEQFFNNHYQLYGRKIRVVTIDPGRDLDSSKRRAVGRSVAALRPFAALSLNGMNTDPRTYEQALLDDGVVTLRSHTLEAPGHRSPNFWTVAPLIEDTERNLAAMLCTSLPPNQPARYGGGAERTRPRKYAVLQPTYSDGQVSPDVTPLVDGLASCGAAVKVMQVPYQKPTSGVNTDWTRYNSTILALRQDEITTAVVFSGAGYRMLTDPMKAASNQGYQPEWVEPGLTYFSSATNLSGPDSAPKEQLDHLLGITPLAKRTSGLPVETQAYQEAHPGGIPQNLVGAGAKPVYDQLQLLAAGIQAAGPRLTPTAFGDALPSVEFPNPGAGEAPAYQATVGFRDDRTMVDDYAVWSWSNTVRDRASGTTGTRCFAANGIRWRLGTWPKDPIPLFPVTPRC